MGAGWLVKGEEPRLGVLIRSVLIFRRSAAGEDRSARIGSGAHRGASLDQTGPDPHKLGGISEPPTRPRGQCPLAAVLRAAIFNPTRESR